MAAEYGHSLAWQTLKCAEYLVLLQAHAEQFWCDNLLESATWPLESLHLDMTRLRTSLASIVRLLPQERVMEKAGQEVDQAVVAFWNQYREEWEGNRMLLMRDVEEVEPDFYAERCRYLLRYSPLAGPWKAVSKSCEGLCAALDSDLRGCFEIGIMLNSEVNPTFTGGQFDREAVSEFTYLAETFAARTRQRVNALLPRFPFLGRLRLTFDDRNPASALPAIDRFRRDFELALCNPEQVPGYLGLLFDREGQMVGRNGLWQPLKGQTRWEILRKLEASREQATWRRELEKAWGDGVNDAPSPESLNKAISDIRRPLVALKVWVELVRNIGYRLADFSELKPDRIRRILEQYPPGGPAKRASKK